MQQAEQQLLEGYPKRYCMASLAAIGLHEDVHEALLAARSPEQPEEEYLNGLDEEAVFVLLNDPSLNRALALRVWKSMLEYRCQSKLATHGAEVPRTSDLNVIPQQDEWIHEVLTSHVVPNEDQLGQSFSQLSQLDNQLARSVSCWGRGNIQSSSASNWGGAGPFLSMWDMGAHLDNPERGMAPCATGSATGQTSFKSARVETEAADENPSEADEVAAQPTPKPLSPRCTQRLHIASLWGAGILDGDLRVSAQSTRAFPWPTAPCRLLAAKGRKTKPIGAAAATANKKSRMENAA